MSNHRRAARRDANEPDIVKALVAAGASITYLGAPKGVPDLLVGYEGRSYLLEVKLPLGPKGGKRGGGSTRPCEGGDGTLTQDQLDWWAEWRGAPPVVVRTPDAALVAIGARPAAPEADR
jgi:hypothetical protein